MQKENRIHGVSEWFLNDDVEGLVDLEAGLANDLVSNLFGYNVLQLGSFYPNLVMNSCRIPNKILVSLGGDVQPFETVRGDVEAFPFGPATIDIIILPHILEFSPDPGKILREVDRVLIGEGYLVVFAFNPWSLFGLNTIFKRWQDLAPWNCSFISALRLEDWLRVLGFEMIEVRYGGYGSLVKKGLLTITGNKEKLMKYLFPGLGNIYFLVAKKRIEGLTAMRTNWSMRRKIVKSGIAKPTVGSVQNP